MARFKVTPTCIRTGNQAPYYMIDCDEQEIEKIAPTLSPLFELPDSTRGAWEPSIDKVLTKFRK